jgi:hypothetical protein
VCVAAEDMTEDVYALLDLFADESADELAVRLRVTAGTIRGWRRLKTAGERINVRGHLARREIRRLRNQPVQDSTPHAEGFLEAIDAMRKKLDELEALVLPPPGEATRLD